MGDGLSLMARIPTTVSTGDEQANITTNGSEPSASAGVYYISKKF